MATDNITGTADNNVAALQKEVQSLKAYVEELHDYLDTQDLLLGKFRSLL
jgi:hypothetical protein